MICNYLIEQNNFMKDFISNSDQIDVNFDSHFDVNFHEINKIVKIDEFNQIENVNQLDNFY